MKMTEQRLSKKVVKCVSKVLW